MNPFTQPIKNSKDPFGKNTDRRGFLARILAGSVAAPAVTKIIKDGVKAPASSKVPEWPTPYAGATTVSGAVFVSGSRMAWTHTVALTSDPCASYSRTPPLS